VSGRDIVVIGASAGGPEAAARLVHGLPTDLRAAVFVAVHASATSRGFLPAILRRCSALPVGHARNGEAIRHGRIYVAPPGCDLRLDCGIVRLSRDSVGKRPQRGIDVMFESAARSYGRRVVGVVLSGMLHDGAEGLKAIKLGGGIAITQHPYEALHAAMPRAAIRHADVDYSLPAHEIATLLMCLTSDQADDDRMDRSAHQERPSESTDSSEPPPRNAVQAALRVALENLDERAALTCHLAAEARDLRRFAVAASLDAQAGKLQGRASVIRRVLGHDDGSGPSHRAPRSRNELIA
jgi:two-component system, chemotaxis family, protein-glutamate methylesterase/glutaminase